MSRINGVFGRLKRERKAAFIAYITAGDPSLAFTEKFVFELERSGVDVIELGVPFSDPIADGPTIQRASVRALSNGTTLHQILRLVKRLRRGPVDPQTRRLTDSQTPIILMSYYNPIFHYGIREFCRDSSKSGVDGIIVPDLPPEEAQDLVRRARENNIDTIFMLSPTSTEGRIRLVAGASRGFIYYVSLTGTTGARRRLPRDLIANIQRIKRFTKKPVCVGFGISTTEQVRAVAPYCDGLIVGSAIVEVIEKNIRERDLVRRVGDFARLLKKSVVTAITPKSAKTLKESSTRNLAS